MNTFSILSPKTTIFTSKGWEKPKPLYFINARNYYEPKLNLPHLKIPPGYGPAVIFVTYTYKRSIHHSRHMIVICQNTMSNRTEFHIMYQVIYSIPFDMILDAMHVELNTIVELSVVSGSGLTRNLSQQYYTCSSSVSTSF